MSLRGFHDRVLAGVVRSIALPLYAGRMRRFEKLLEHSRDVQRRWLIDRVNRCRETRFGRDHGFARIRTIDDFRRQVPIAEYERFEPYIKAVAEGEFRALVPGSEQVARFTITTGSSGTPKLNPVTTAWLREYRLAWSYWGLKLLLDHPRQVGGKILHMAGTWNMGRTPAGIPISMVSTLNARRQHPLVNRFYVIPHVVGEISDPLARYYVTLRLSIPEPIGLIVAMNPGTLVKLAQLGNERRQTLIRDIHDGTLSAELNIPDDIRRTLRARVGLPDRRRARALEQIVERTGRLYPRDYWRTPIIACWLGGTAGFQARYLPEYFGDVPMRDMGLVSSEGRHTIPIADSRPEGVLAVTGGYYEFVPVAEIRAASPVALEGHELEFGRDYYLIMTTSGGYYRFNIGDVVRCCGFAGEAPLLEFLQKGGRCGDLEGEKVTEHQFAGAAGAAACALGIHIGWVTAVPFRPGRELPCYAIVAEHGDLSDSNLAARFLEQIDQQLKSVNFLYSARRREGVLGAPRLVRIPDGSWNDYLRAEMARRGTSDVQYKHPGLVTDATWLERFAPVDVVRLTERR